MRQINFYSPQTPGKCLTHLAKYSFQPEGRRQKEKAVETRAWKTGSGSAQNYLEDPRVTSVTSKFDHFSWVKMRQSGIWCHFVPIVWAFVHACVKVNIGNFTGGAHTLCKNNGPLVSIGDPFQDHPVRILNSMDNLIHEGGQHGTAITYWGPHLTSHPSQKPSGSIRKPLPLHAGNFWSHLGGPSHASEHLQM